MLLAYAANRVAFYSAALVGASMLPFAPAWSGQVAVTQRAALAVHWRWDALFYFRIALYGYTPPPHPAISQAEVVAFFPLFPLLCRAVALLLAGGRTSGLAAWLPASGVLVANVALGVALILLFQLAVAETNDRSVADRTVFFAAVFPLAWYYSVPYAESLFLAASLGTFYAVRHGRWITAGCCAAAASATRPFGWLLTLVLATEIARSWRHGQASVGWWRAVLGLLLAPSGLLLFMVHLWRLTGDPLAFAHAQQQVWDRSPMFPLLTLWRSLILVLHPGLSADADMYARTLLHTTIVVAFLIVTLVSLRRWRFSWVLYGLLLFALVLAVPWPGATLMHTLGRSVMVFFPVYIELGRWGRRPAVHHLVLALWLPLFGLLAALYVCWYFVA